MQRSPVVAFLIVLSLLHVIALGRATEERRLLPKADGSAYVIPGSLIKITALEFDGLASDIMFLRALLFMGSTYERKETPRVKSWEWKWFYDTLTASTDIDPYFLDPYLLGNAYLTWGGGMVNEANTLLEKGSRYRDWDWTLPLYIGFNHFYFLRQNEKASMYLMHASRRPGASPILASLAANLAYKERKTENAVIFMQEILTRTEDEDLKKYFEMRLEYLNGVLLLEKGVSRYKAKFHKVPSNLNQLVKERILMALPADPYGGTYYVDSKGIVKSTSELQLMPQ
ncbi:MAG: hypothetical protein A2Z46_08235 [Nitrospirae bacterium RBG_19FT_COMBO_55_12]|nr:MAG: hypothetical protein A2Z46_08235 [Nitrospirae bacterium RBG_19FT_COMBO_55_12]